jgi:hypothetical protein
MFTQNFECRATSFCNERHSNMNAAMLKDDTLSQLGLNCTMKKVLMSTAVSVPKYETITHCTVVLNINIQRFEFILI